MPNALTGSIDKTVHKLNIVGFVTDDFKHFNPDGYTIMCRLGETCDGLHFFPNTSKIVLESNGQSRLLYSNLETEFIPKVAQDLGISQEAAIKKSMDFFADKSVVIQPTGLQGKFYNTMRYAQNSVPMYYTSEAVSALKTSGMTGMQVISKASLTFVGASYIGAIFFGYFGSVAGNNSVGSVFNFTSFVLSRPMRVVEITLNGLILQPISNIVGLPIILNGTQELLNGQGIAVQDYKKIGIAFERISNSTIVKNVKDIYSIFKS